MRIERGHSVETSVDAGVGFLDRPIIPVLLVSAMLGAGLLAACVILLPG